MGAEILYGSGHPKFPTLRLSSLVAQLKDMAYHEDHSSDAMHLDGWRSKRHDKVLEAIDLLEDADGMHLNPQLGEK